MYKNLIANSSYLYLLHFANLILPLLVFPYLVRVLGAEKFGYVAFATAFIGYFSLLVNYGFDLGSTQSISINRNNIKKINQIFSATLYIKLILLILSFVLMVSISFFFEILQKNITLFYLAFGIVIGFTLMPSWLYQGLEKLVIPAIVGLFTRFLYLLLIFIYVESSNDFTLVILITSLTSVLNGLLGLFIAFLYLDVDLVKVSKNFFFKTLTDNWSLFISKISVNIYSISTIFILGLFWTEVQVGIYAAAERIVRAIQGLLNPISNAFYPQMASILNSNLRETGLKSLVRVGSVVCGSFLLISMALFLFSEEIVNVILGGGYESSIEVVKILAFLPFIIALSNFCGVQYMLNSNMKKIYVNIIVVASLLSLCLMIVFVPYYSFIGLSYVLLFIELFVLIVMMLSIFLHNSKNFKKFN